MRLEWTDYVCFQRINAVPFYKTLLKLNCTVQWMALFPRTYHVCLNEIREKMRQKPHISFSLINVPYASHFIASHMNALRLWYFMHRVIFLFKNIQNQVHISFYAISKLCSKCFQWLGICGICVHNLYNVQFHEYGIFDLNIYSRNDECAGESKIWLWVINISIPFRISIDLKS